MRSLHPGVEILATAIDQLKNDDYLRFPEGRVVYPLLVVLLTSSCAGINLTGPFAVVLAYYALVRLYGVVTRKVLETSALRDSAEREGELGVLLLLIRVEGADQRVTVRTIRKLREVVAGLCSEPRSADPIDGRQKGVWSLFEHRPAISWIFAADDPDARGHAAVPGAGRPGACRRTVGRSSQAGGGRDQTLA